MATMKAYSIGREAGCNIVINDSTDVISRRHAILNVYSNGKMTITDQSHNGTYVNGIRISQNVPVPVTRKDNISFAHVARLDWNQVPGASGSSTWKIVLFSVLGLLVAGGIVAAILLLGGKGSSIPEPDNDANVAQVDSLKQDNDTIQGNVDEADKEKVAEEAEDKKDEAVEKKCPVCGKKLSECLYEGKHPRCNSCGKATDGTAKNRCQYNGSHPKCQYKDCGKVVGARKNACPYNGDVKKHEDAAAKKKIEEEKNSEQYRRN